MPERHVLFWFDVEDCTVTQSDDAAKRLCEILEKHGVRGTMKLVGQKARVMRDRVRYDAMDALARHVIGFHGNWHGGRPQPAEYMGPLDWLEGAAEFERRERQGVEDLIEIWGSTPVTYGQPGCNWSPQVFPALRKWGISTYVSGFGYVGLYAQPFWYGGIINTSHMYGCDRRGREVRHFFVLGFELGMPGALEEHKRIFDESYQALDDGGLISIANHPCQLVLERWFSTDMKPRELTAAGYEHFDRFIEYVASHDDIEMITADQLPLLYPDRAMGRVFGREELLVMTRNATGGVRFQEFDELSISAAELFGMFARFVARATTEGAVPPGEVCAYLDGPAMPSLGTATGFAAAAEDFARCASETAEFIRIHRRLPDSVRVGDVAVTPGDYFLALSHAAAQLIEHGRLPDEIPIREADNLLDEHVDEQAARSAWSSAMMLPGFSAPKLLDQARLQAWTLKPAILAAH